MIGGFFDNNPTFSYVKVKGLTIIYNDNSYIIQDMYTSCKYLYWDITSPNILIETNLRPVKSANKFLVCINDNGIHTQVDNDELIYNFSGTGGGSSSGVGDLDSSPEFVALKTQVSENTKKYASLGSTVDSFSRIIGDETQLENGDIIQNISLMKSTANEITNRVSDMEVKFTHDAELSAIKDEVSSSLIALLTSVSTYHYDFGSISKNIELEEEDLNQLNDDLHNINEKMLLMELPIALALDELRKQSKTEYVTTLQSAFNNVKTSINSLISLHESILSDNDISANDITLMIKMIGDTTEKINILKTTCDEVLLLGLGGSLYESFAEMKTTNDRIQLNVSETYTTKGEFQNLSIGGRNLALKTNIDESYWHWILGATSVSPEIYKEDGIWCSKMTRDFTPYEGVSVIYYHYDAMNLQGLKPLTNYTVTFEVKSSVEADFLCSFTQTSGINRITDEIVTSKTIPNEWVTISFTLNTYENAEISNQVLYMKPSNSNIGVSYAFRHLKIEEGNKKTSWSPAPEDVDVKIKGITDELTNNYSTTTEVKSLINQKANEIDLSVSEKYTTKKEFGDVKGSVEEWNEAKINLTPQGITQTVTSAKDANGDPIFVTGVILDNKLNDFEDALSDILSDGIIDEAELKIIEQHLVTIDREKADIDAKFNQLYNNTVLN